MDMCPVCREPITPPGVTTRVVRWRRSEVPVGPFGMYELPGECTRELVCQRCAKDGPRVGDVSCREVGPWLVWGGVGYGYPPPREAACTVCGRTVLRPVFWKPTGEVTCSDRCRLRAYRARVTAARRTQTRGTLRCGRCGAAMTGRADRRYCSPACRQRAYRNRH